MNPQQALVARAGSSDVPMSRLGRALRHYWGTRYLTTLMVKREVVGRYRGSILGLFWSFLTPAVMLALYTFVFSGIFGARWVSEGNGQSETSGFAIIVFAGLILHGFFAEILTRSPTLIYSNVIYVKKVMFPLEILPVVAVGSALFHALVSVAVLLICQFAITRHLPVTLLWLPAVLAPFVVLTVGIGWFLASLGVYFRDTTQVLGPLAAALLFLSPILYPPSRLPEIVRPYLILNPLTFIIEQTRGVLIRGVMPDLVGLAVYSVIALLVAAAGLLWFQKTRRGFADVL